MAVTIPVPDDLYAFWGDEADDVDEDRAQLFLTLASQLLWLATGIEEDPTDARVANLVKYAICDMAIYLFITRDDIDASYSPFQSERVGSYSYSKTYNALARQLMTNTNAVTGVPLFDAVVQYFLDQVLFEGGMVSSEHVFQQGYTPLYQVANPWFRWVHDPSVGYTTRKAWYAYFGGADSDVTPGTFG